MCGGLLFLFSFVSCGGEAGWVGGGGGGGGDLYKVYIIMGELNW